MRPKCLLFLVPCLAFSLAEGQQTAASANLQRGQSVTADTALRFTVASVKPSRLPPALVIANSGLKIPNTPSPRPKQSVDSNFATDAFPMAPPEFTGVIAFAPEGMNGPDERPLPAPTADDAPGDIFSALQSDLGIRLESRGPVEIIVINHAEKVPKDN